MARLMRSTADTTGDKPTPLLTFVSPKIAALSMELCVNKPFASLEGQPELPFKHPVSQCTELC